MYYRKDIILEKNTRIELKKKVQNDVNVYECGGVQQLRLVVNKS
jgi:hypothetical protein